MQALLRPGRLRRERAQWNRWFSGASITYSGDLQTLDDYLFLRENAIWFALSLSDAGLIVRLNLFLPGRLEALSLQTLCLFTFFLEYNVCP